MFGKFPIKGVTYQHLLACAYAVYGYAYVLEKTTSYVFVFLTRVINLKKTLLEMYFSMLKYDYFVFCFQNALGLLEYRAKI